MNGRVLVAVDRVLPRSRNPRHSAAQHPLHVLQRTAGNAAVARLVQVQRNKQRPDRRTRLLEGMTEDMMLADGQSDRLLRSLQPFTINQLQQMVDVGVRFWGPTGVPPALEGLVLAPEIDVRATAGARASYIPEARFVRVRPGSGVAHIIHELAHAWDHVRGGRLRPLRRLLRAADPVEALAAEGARTADAMWTESAIRHRTRDASGRSVRLTMAEMLERYRSRDIRREERFGTPGTREGYSASTVREFYAEGFAVFHAGSDEQRARLQAQAPELYHLLAREHGRAPRALAR